jgi:hypothetical protein
MKTPRCSSDCLPPLFNRFRLQEKAAEQNDAKKKFTTRFVRPAFYGGDCMKERKLLIEVCE